MSISGLYTRYMIHRDIPHIIDIDHECFDPDYWWLEDDFLNEMSLSVSFVAEWKHKLLGFVFHRSGEIIKAAVLPEWRRKGIGKKLLKRISHGKISCSVPKDMVEAQLWLKGCTFKGEEQSDSIVFVKETKEP